MATYTGLVEVIDYIVLPKDYVNGLYEVGTIAGTIKTQTAPATFVPTYARVVLFRDHDLQPIKQMWSDRVTGAWSFDNIDKHLTYTVIAYHPTLAYRGVLADGVFPT